MKALVSALIVLTLTGQALAADIESRRSGPWNSTSTWLGGVVPGASDAVTITAPHGVDLPAGALSVQGITVNGTLATNGTTTLTTFGIVVSDGGELVLEGTRTATDSLHIVSAGIGASPKTVVDVYGTISGSGSMTFDVEPLAAEGNDAIIRVREGGTVTWGGYTFGTASVTAVDDSPARPKLQITVSRDYEDATHVRTKSGMNPGWIYRILDRPSANTLLLERGRAYSRSGGSDIAFVPPIVAGEDSVKVTSTIDTDMGDYLGRIILTRNGATGAQLGAHQVYNAAFRLTGTIYRSWTLELRPPTFTHDVPGDAWTAADATATEIILVESIYEGVDLEFLRLPTIGLDAAPTTLLEAAQIVVEGTWSANRGVIYGLGSSGTNAQAGFLVTPNELESWSFKNLYLVDFRAQNPIAVAQGGTAVNQEILVDRCHFENNTEPYVAGDTSYGHWINFDNVGNHLRITNSVLNGITDDVLYLEKGFGVHVVDNNDVFGDFGRANFIDCQANPSVVSILSTNNRVFGVGSEAYITNTAESGGTAVVTMYSANNMFTCAGQRFNRSLIGTEDASRGRTFGVSDFAAFTSVNDTIYNWTLKGVEIAQDSDSGEVDIYGLLVSRGGNPHLTFPDSNSIDVNAGNGSRMAPIDIVGSNVKDVSIRSSRFIDGMYRQEAFRDAGGRNDNWCAGIITRGTTGSPTITIDRCVFDGKSNLVVGSQNHSWFYISDSLTGGVTNDLILTNSVFRHGVTPLNFPGSGSQDITIRNCVIVGGQYRGINLGASRTGVVTLEDNTIYWFPTDPSAQDQSIIHAPNSGLSNLIVKRNILLQQDPWPNSSAIRVNAAYVDSDIDWNIVRSSPGTPYFGYADCAAWVTAGGGSNHDCASNLTDIHQIIRYRDAAGILSKAPRLVAVRDTVSAAIDFVDDGATFDTDLSKGDAGALPHLIDY